MELLCLIKWLDQALNPALPTGGKVEVASVPQAEEQFIDEGTGQVGEQPSADTTTAGVATADPVSGKSS